MSEKPKRKPGRPTKYREEYAGEVYKLCLLGATDEQIADFFEVDVATVYRWTNEIPAFCEARKDGKERADANVARSLYHRAIGYEHQAVKIMSYEGESWEHAYVERYPPDTGAACFWLKNRAGWRDRFELTGKDGGPIEFKDVSDDDLVRTARQHANRIAALTANRNGNGNGNGRNGHGAGG